MSHRTQRPHVNDSGSCSRGFSATASSLLQLQPATMRVVTLRCKRVVLGAKRCVSQRPHLKTRASTRKKGVGELRAGCLLRRICRNEEEGRVEGVSPGCSPRAGEEQAAEEERQGK